MDQQVLDRKLAKVQQRLSLNAINQDLLVLTRKQTFQDTREPKTIKIHLKKNKAWSLRVPKQMQTRSNGEFLFAPKTRWITFSGVCLIHCVPVVPLLSEYTRVKYMIHLKPLQT